MYGNGYKHNGFEWSSEDQMRSGIKEKNEKGNYLSDFFSYSFEFF